MLRKKALRKIFVTTMSFLIIMTIYLIPFESDTLNTNLELEYVTNLANSSIYLLDENNYLVKTKVLLDDYKLTDKIKDIVTNLTVNDNLKFPNKLKGVIPKDTKLRDVSVDSDTVTLDFSKEFLNVSKNISKILIQSLVFSITELDGINKVIIKVDSNVLNNYPNDDKKLVMPLTRDIGINNEYCYDELKNIIKVFVYYTMEIDDFTYYVPVTKYMNNYDDKNKIDIIVEELTTSYIFEDNLKSILNENVSLLDQEFIDDLLILNFNDALFDGGSTIKEEVLYMLSYSFFENYSVNVINFKVNGTSVNTVKRSDLM